MDLQGHAIMGQREPTLIGPKCQQGIQKDELDDRQHSAFPLESTTEPESYTTHMEAWDPDVQRAKTISSGGARLQPEAGKIAK